MPCRLRPAGRKDRGAAAPPSMRQAAKLREASTRAAPLTNAGNCSAGSPKLSSNTTIVLPLPSNSANEAFFSSPFKIDHEHRQVMDEVTIGGSEGRKPAELMYAFQNHPSADTA
jgi:hypothetical protein